MNLQAAREQMVEQQVRAWDVLDERVLQTMLQVQREEFAPLRYRDVAFADSAIPLAHGQTMLPAKVHGRILQALGGRRRRRRAWKSAPAAATCPPASASSPRACARWRFSPSSPSRHAPICSPPRINNVSVESADAMQLNEQSAYDVIAVTGSLPIYDERFQQALRIGGRLFVVVGQPPIMEAWRVVRVGEREWQRQALFETVLEPLVNAPRPSAFVF